MPPVNRNDPCPCGSGKKNKHCCMRQDRLSASRELSVNPYEGQLLNMLYEYVQGAPFASNMLEAFRLYWGGVFDIDGISELAPDDVRRFFEWFAHDHRIGEERRHLLDLFAEKRAADFAPEAKQILAAWSQSAYGLFRALGFDSQGHLDLYDCLRQAKLTVHDASLARNVQRGDLLIGRLFELDGVKRMSYMTMVLPEAYEQGLVAYITNAYKLYQSEHFQASWDEFLRVYGYIFVAYLLSDKAASLRSLIGPGTRFHDPAAGQDRLRAFTQRRLAERQEELRREEDRASEAPAHRTAAGIIVPGEEPAAARPGAQKDETASRPTILIPGRDF
jgi:hypothetical protein